MPTSRLALTALALTAPFLAATGCAPSQGTTRLEREGNATLTGIVAPPSGAGPLGGTSCTGVRVRVFHAGEPTRPLGSAMVKQSRERCLYVVSNLPSNAELRLEVSPGPGWRCAEGDTPVLTPGPGAVRLRDYETATRDFRITCG